MPLLPMEHLARLRTLIVFSHPGDETIGLGAHLHDLGELSLVCVTDGAPSDPDAALRAGCATRREYARLRERELIEALNEADQATAPLVFLRFGEQEATFQLAEITRALGNVIEELQPDVIITVPYQGGHPDHDATAFSVRAAVELCRTRTRDAPYILEMTAYQVQRGQRVFSAFLPDSDDPPLILPLDAEGRTRKSRLLECHASQTPMLRGVPLERELLRIAPQYDFGLAPHAGPLGYESFPWAPSAARWREFAMAALDELGLIATLPSSRALRLSGSRS